MKILDLHPWNVSGREAIQIQRGLAAKVSLKNDFEGPNLIAGADIAIDEGRNEAVAGVIVFSFPDMKEVERSSARRKIQFPYVPGLLSFREAPALLAAIEKLQCEPDIFMFDGQGIAHPRGLGLASHLGLALDKAAIGCAKSVLVGEFQGPGQKKGSRSPLVYKEKNVGFALRSRDGVKPVFVSPGHKIDLESSVRLVLRCCDGVRIPKPTRAADHWVGELKTLMDMSFPSEVNSTVPSLSVR